MITLMWSPCQSVVVHSASLDDQDDQDKGSMIDTKCQPCRRLSSPVDTPGYDDDNNAGMQIDTI